MKQLLIILILLLLLGANSLFAQWSLVGGPKGNSVSISIIRFNGNSIYVGSYDGVFCSVDDGENWIDINAGLTSSSGMYVINCLECYGNNVYVGLKDGLYVLYPDNQVWYRLGTTLTNKMVTSIKFVGQNIIVSTLFNGIFLSTDGGANWIESNSGLSDLVVYELVNDNSKLFTRNDSQICCSTDTTKNWILLASSSGGSFGGGFFTALAVQDSNIYVGTSWGYLYRSTDNGINWNYLTSVTNSIQSIVISGSTILFNASDKIYRSTNNGKSWSTVMSGLQTYSKIEVHGTNFYVGIYGSGIYFSSNNGTNWYLFSKVSAYNELLSLAVFKSNILVGTIDGIFHSSDNGNNWLSSNSGLPQFNFTYALANNGSNFYAGFDDGVYLSTNNGISWEAINNSLPSNAGVHSIAILDSYIFAGTTMGIYLSTNNGSSWSPSSQGLPTDSNIYSLGIDGPNIYAGLKGKLYLSTNNGSNWEQTDLGTADWTIKGILFQGSDLFIISNGTIYFSRDYGLNWRMVNDGISKQTIQSICYDNSFLYVATYKAGIWKLSIDDNILDVNDKQKFLFSDFGLSQNYPNPFNPSTTINYELPRAAKVSIRIFDLLGREIATLVDEYTNAGSYEIEFKAGQLSSGVYFYKLKAGNYVATKKMILLK